MSFFVVLISIIIPVTFAFIAILWWMLYHIERKHSKFVFNQENSVRTIIVDKANNKVKFFNRNKLKNVREISLDQFYVQFSSDDVKRLDNWFDDLVRKNSKASDFIEVEVFMNKNRKKYLTVLKCVEANKDLKIIHIESYLFLHLSTRTKLGYKLTDVPLQDVVKRLKLKPTIRGSTINFKFTFVNKNSTQTEVDRLLFTQLKEIALYYAYPPQKYLIETGLSEFTIIDFRNSDINAITSFIHTTVNAIKKFLQINSMLVNTSISVGVVANKHYPNNAEKLISKSQEMANIAHEKNTLIISYVKNYDDNQENHDSEIERIIKEKKLSYTFTPIYSVKQEKIIGYFTNCVPVNASAKTIEELYLRSVKTEENKKLLTSIIKSSTSIFISQNDNSNIKLFRYLKFHDCHTFLNLFKSMQLNFEGANNVKYVVCFDEYDISYYISKNKDFYDVISKLTNKGIEVCLKLSDKSSILDGKIYSIFDYFIVATKMDKKRMQNNANIEYRVICEKLLKYHRPIILSNVEGWSMIELLVRSGIEYIASGTISPIGEILSTPSSKNIVKIRHMLD